MFYVSLSLWILNKNSSTKQNSGKEATHHK